MPPFCDGLLDRPGIINPPANQTLQTETLYGFRIQLQYAERMAQWKNASLSLCSQVIMTKQDRLETFTQKMDKNTKKCKKSKA